MADDGKRSEAEWTLYDAGIEERGVPGGEGTRIGRDRWSADFRKMVPKMELDFIGSVGDFGELKCSKSRSKKGTKIKHP